MKADINKIEWLLFKSEKTISQISKEADVSWSTVSDFKKKKSNIENMTLLNAIKLTKYAEKLNGKEKKLYK